VVKNKAMVFTFGGNGFFGYSSSGPVSTQSLMWWSTFESASLPDTQNLDVAKITADLGERHKDWKDPIIQDIIRNAAVQSIYPTWVLPELPHWGEDNIVLVGDAAHAMDPTTGQGASQALEDSQTLALLLAELLKPTQTEHEKKEAIASAGKMYYKIRSPRVQEIVDRGKKISGSKASVGVVAEYFLYFFLWMMMRYPTIGESPHAKATEIADEQTGKIMLGDVNQKLYAWSADKEIKSELEAVKESHN
jgi:2-polyprenyl-6-methoxyphenol hydroxylase-like FAD-dependent oxidoreductase